MPREQLDLTRRYFLAAGSSRSAVDAFEESREIAFRSINAFRKEVGAIEIQGPGGETASFFRFRKGKKLGNEWAPVRRETADRLPAGEWFKPNPRTNAGKALKRRIATLRAPTMRDFGSLIGASDSIEGHLGGMVLKHAWFQRLGDDIVISVPGKSKAPPDAEEISPARYLTLLEEHNAKAESAA